MATELPELTPIVKAISRFNEQSILIDFNPNHTHFSLDFLLASTRYLEKKLHQQILYITHTYHSLLIIYKSTISNFYSQKTHLLDLLIAVNLGDDSASRLVSIPVCYHEKFALDLKVFEQQKQLQPNALIKLHTSKIYRVFFIGFLPGFPYLSNVNHSLKLDRKSKPRPKISAGAVGIAGLQTGIYPVDSPGGWQIIGQTPLRLFDSASQQSFLKAGDRIQFKPIGLDEFEEIKVNLFNNYNFQNQFIDES